MRATYELARTSGNPAILRMMSEIAIKQKNKELLRIIYENPRTDTETRKELLIAMGK